MRSKTHKKKHVNKKYSRKAGTPHVSSGFFKEYFIERNKIRREIEEQTKKELEKEKMKEREKILLDRLSGDCAICLDSMDENNDKSDLEKAIKKCSGCFRKKNIISQLPCDHFFHEKCINNWLKESMTCPECRTDLTEETDNDYADFINYY